MIRLEGLTKRYGGFLAVSALDLEVKQGEVFGFLGPNGAGKTTTMKAMVGLIRPSAGRVIIGGIDVQRDPIAARRLIGYIPDRPYLYEKLSGREMLTFVGGLYRIPPRVVAARSEELLDRFDLRKWAEELIESYSHGMKQRLTMAAALLHEPQVLVVDEPMVGLDPRGAVLVKDIFRRLARDHGRTVFLSTHTLGVAEELCHRVAILNHGSIIALGSVEQIRERMGAPGGDLEQLFLALTGGQADQPGLA